MLRNAWLWESHHSSRTALTIHPQNSGRYVVALVERDTKLEGINPVWRPSSGRGPPLLISSSSSSVWVVFQLSSNSGIRRMEARDCGHAKINTLRGPSSGWGTPITISSSSSFVWVVFQNSSNQKCQCGVAERHDIQSAKTENARELRQAPGRRAKIG